MADADVLLNKILKWVNLQKQCVRKFNRLADELEATMKSANKTKVVGSSVSVGGATAMTGAGLLTLVTGGAALPVLAMVGVAGGLASLTSVFTTVGSEAAVASKSNDAMEEAKKTVEELYFLEDEIQDLMKPLKPGAGGRQPSGCCDDDNGDANIMEQLLRSEAKRQGLDLSHSVNLRKMCGLPKANIFKKIIANSALLLGSVDVLLKVLMWAGKEGGKRVAKSLGKGVASKAAGCVAGGALGLLFSVPELVSDCKNLDICETEASKTLRENAKAVRTTAEEMEKELQKIREAVQKLVQIQLIIKKKKRSMDDNNELIQCVMDNTQDEVVRQWLREKQKTDVFLKLVDLFKFIKGKVDEEEKKKKERKNKIDLIFVAHGGITDKMIPARCLLPLSSITDVILYSPWNCILTAKAAYRIATGRIEPGHRKFKCADPTQCHPDTDHEPSGLPDHWNSMRDSKKNDVPIIMVSPVGKPGDKAFPDFLRLQNKYGQPGEDRYVIPYLDLDTGRVPFFVVTLALSLVLFSYKYEATVHLAACLNKNPKDTMNEKYLKQQYCYTVDYTMMSVKSHSISKNNDQLFNMMSAVFG